MEAFCLRTATPAIFAPSRTATPGRTSTFPIQAVQKRSIKVRRRSRRNRPFTRENGPTIEHPAGVCQAATEAPPQGMAVAERPVVEQVAISEDLLDPPMLTTREAERLLSLLFQQLNVIESPPPLTPLPEKKPPQDPTLPHVHRPRYHLQPPKGWANDPNGPIYINGQYHLFYQHLPGKAHWDWGIIWGHAVSSDLVHWEHLPTALAPTPGGYDNDGAFSGCCVNDGGVATILYTGVQRAGENCSLPVTSASLADGAEFTEVQILGRMGEDGRIVKREEPVIKKPPEGLDLIGFRDPYVFREGDEWYMLLGSGIQGVGGTALLYRSSDLIDWEYLRPIWVGDRRVSGSMWECPLLIKSGNWRMFCVSPDSPNSPVLYWVGTFHRGEFVPVKSKHPQRLDLGNVVYAATTCIDGKGRHLLWAWVQEVRSTEASVEAGYAGCLTLPRKLSIRDDGVLLQEPVEEMALLREAQLVQATQVKLTPTRPIEWAVHTGCLEIEVEIERGSAEAVGVDIRESTCHPEICELEDDENAELNATRAQRVLGIAAHEGVLVSYDYRKAWLEVSWWQPGAQHTPDSRGELVSKGGPLALDLNENLHLRIFVDNSVVEVFANGRAVLTTRMYRDVISTALVAKGGSAMVLRTNVWRMGTGVA